MIWNERIWTHQTQRCRYDSIAVCRILSRCVRDLIDCLAISCFVFTCVYFRKQHCDANNWWHHRFIATGMKSQQTKNTNESYHLEWLRKYFYLRNEDREIQIWSRYFLSDRIWGLISFLSRNKTLWTHFHLDFILFYCILLHSI